MRKRGFCGRCYPAPVVFSVYCGGVLLFAEREKGGVRFFTHASRRKNLKREAARGGWIFMPCPRMTLPGAVVGLPVGSADVSPRPAVRMHTSAFPLGCPSPSFIRATFRALRGWIGESFPAPGRLRCYPARGVSMCIRRIPAPLVFGTWSGGFVSYLPPPFCCARRTNGRTFFCICPASAGGDNHT